MRVATVHKHRHFKLGRQRKLGGKRFFLFGWSGKVTVEIESAFTNGHHLRRFRQPVNDFSALRRPLATVVRMHAGGRPAALVALRQLLRLLAFMQVGARQQQSVHPGGKRARNHLITIFRKLRTGQIKSDIKHANPHVTTALTGGWFYSSVLLSETSSSSSARRPFPT